MPPSGKATPVSQGLIARITGLFRRTNDGRHEDPFDPGEPPDVEQQREVRAWDYPGRYNVAITQERDNRSTFEQLRGLADGCDVLRLAIETRKDQMCRLAWDIRRRSDKSANDPELDALREQFRYPDAENSWSTWLRMLLEEMFVLDALSIYPRQTLSGGIMGFEILDGSTIKPVIDGRGRKPLAGPAFQQVIKGIPYANFGRDQLIYEPRNRRVHKVYGFSPVEQIVLTVNTAIRRAVHQLAYYSEGNIPEAFMGVPEEWTPDQIVQFQEYWDGLLAGDSGRRRHMKFLPGKIASNFVQVRENVMKDEYDEWLARVICYAFSLPPTQFIRQMNRATAETSNVSSLEEGIEPTKLYVKDVMDTLLRQLGRPEFEFVFRYESSLDRHKQAQIHEVYVRSGIISPNEARHEIGLEPRTGGDEYAKVQKQEADTGGIRSNASDPANSMS